MLKITTNKKFIKYNDKKTQKNTSIKEFKKDVSAELWIAVDSTNQIWILSEEESKTIYIGGTSNRNTTGFSNQLPGLIKQSFYS